MSAYVESVKARGEAIEAEMAAAESDDEKASE